MYYSYKCPYCGRVFYTYDTNKERASRTLYFTIKQHLIDYNEDHKEYVLDDGEEADSDQIYEEMVESNIAPPGGYKATLTSLNQPETHSSPSSYSSVGAIIFLVVLIGLLIAIFVFFPNLVTSFIASLSAPFQN